MWTLLPVFWIIVLLVRQPILRESGISDAVNSEPMKLASEENNLAFSILEGIDDNSVLELQLNKGRYDNKRLVSKITLQDKPKFVSTYFEVCT